MVLQGVCGGRNGRGLASRRNHRYNLAMVDVPQAEALGLVDEAVRTTVARLLDENNVLRSTLASVQSRIDELERLADMDTLTPLPNRRAFLRDLERSIARVERYGVSAALMFVDVDDLKALNDAHGHAAGDGALKHIAAVLRRGVRAGDLVARIGGDEFALLVEPVDEAAARAKAATLLAAAAESAFEWTGAAVPVGISIGLAMIEPGDTIDSLLARADARMYETKAAQRSAR